MATISQRISLDGGDDVRKKLQEIGKAGEQAFKQIQDAAKKPIVDQGQLDRLATSLQSLTRQVQQFGSTGAQAGQQAAQGLNQANAAAQETQGTFSKLNADVQKLAGQQLGTNLASSARGFQIAAVGVAAGIAALIGALTKGAAAGASEIADQAAKLKVTIPQWLELRKQIEAAGGDVEEFVKAAEKVGKTLEGAAGGAVKLGGATVTLSKFGENVVRIFGGVADTTSQASQSVQKIVDTLLKAGTPMNIINAALDAIARQKPADLMKAYADAIARVTDENQKAALGLTLLGPKWQDIVKALTTAKSAADETKEAIRQLSAEQVKRGEEVKKAWDDVGEAFKALKDRIGSLFFSTKMPEWLSETIDGVNKLLQQFIKLDEEGKAGFLKSLGDSAAETTFKILVDLGTQLSALWNNVLVPAGQALMRVFFQIFGSIEGVTKSQITAFFVTTTIVVIGLTVALRLLGLVLAPLSLLFTGLGPVLIAAGVAVVAFWDQLVAGAQQAAALVPNSLALIAQSFRRLFAGDFRGFWRDFSEGAVTAFQTLKQAAEQDTGAIGIVFRTLEQILNELPGAIKLVAQAFFGLFQAMQGVADLINKIFGTQLTGTDIAFLVIIGQMIGAFQLLASVMTIVSGAVGILLGFFGGPLLAVLIVVGAAVVTLIALWPEMQRVFLGMAQAITNGWNAMIQAIQNGVNWITSTLGSIWNSIKQSATSAWQAITDGWNTMIQAIQNGANWVMSTLGSIWDTFKQAGLDAFAAVSDAINGVIGVVNSLIDAISNSIQWLKNLLGLGSQVGQGAAIANPAAPGALAGGGYVGGRGTGTSDSNLAWLSRGEYITPARAVRQPGVLAFLEALRRSGGNLQRVIDRMGHFALGGLVAPMPAFAGGGLNSMSNVTIQFPGLPAIGGLRAPSDVVEELRKAAALAQVRSGGRKPSRYS